MSASLVGSEMCIRDRSKVPWKTICSSAASPIVGLVAQKVGAPGRHSRPVSYTHLTLPTICSV
eukprot:6714862-Alexandrium_andersonii.AAC.1